MTAKKNVASEIKLLLPDPNDRIKLDDYVTEFLRTALNTITTDSFWANQPPVNGESIKARLSFYEAATSDLMTICILLGRWATDEQTSLLNKIFLRLSETTKATNGLTFWNNIRWYPLSLLTYAAGISALSAGNYKVMRCVLLQPVYAERDSGAAQIVVQAGSNMAEADDGFKRLPGQDRKRVPRSEYMFELLKTPLDDLLFLGEGYEGYFDEFEILSALTYADITASDRGGRLWGPVGRFGWKGAMPKYIERALAEGANCPLLKAGLFSSKQDRFKEVAKGYLEFLSTVSRY